MAYRNRYKKGGIALSMQYYAIRIIAYSVTLIIMSGIGYYCYQYPTARKYFLIHKEIVSIVIFLMIALFFSLVDIIPRIFKQKKERKRYLHSCIREIDVMPGEVFERLLKAHFERLGYKVTLTPKTNDYGADLVLQKDGKLTLVQAKRYKGKIGNDAIREIFTAKGYYAKKYGIKDLNTIQCMVVTNSYFTNNARNLAFANGVKLWDRNVLMETFKIND